MGRARTVRLARLVAQQVVDERGIAARRRQRRAAQRQAELKHVHPVLRLVRLSTCRQCGTRCSLD